MQLDNVKHYWKYWPLVQRGNESLPTTKFRIEKRKKENMCLTSMCLIQELELQVDLLSHCGAYIFIPNAMVLALKDRHTPMGYSETTQLPWKNRPQWWFPHWLSHQEWTQLYILQEETNDCLASTETGCLAAQFAQASWSIKDV